MLQHMPSGLWQSALSCSTREANLKSQTTICMQTPAVTQLLSTCAAIEAFLEQQPLNIAVVHCQGSCRAALLVLTGFLLMKVRILSPPDNLLTTRQTWWLVAMGGMSGIRCPSCPNASSALQGIAKQPAAAIKAVRAKLPCPAPRVQPSDLRCG